MTPFYWEPVDLYIDRYGLEDVYVFSSDFPHREGSKQPHLDFHERAMRYGDSFLEKFFVTNGQLLVSGN